MLDAETKTHGGQSLLTDGLAGTVPPAPTFEREQMTHIDDWLDDPTTGPADVKEWLEQFRRPAIEKDHAWLRSRQLFCTYKDGKRYRCIGCSRMGDVWLTKHFERENGYDLRIDIADCTDWEVVSNTK